MFNKKLMKKIDCLEEKILKLDSIRGKLSDAKYLNKCEVGLNKNEVDKKMLSMMNGYQKQVNKNNEKLVIDFFHSDKSKRPKIEKVSFEGFLKYSQEKDKKRKENDLVKSVQNAHDRLSSHGGLVNTGMGYSEYYINL